MTRNILHILIACVAAAVVALGMPGCKSSKKAASKEAYIRGEASQPLDNQRQPQAPAVTPRTLASDFSAMTGAYSAWTDVTVPVKVSVEKPKKITVSGTLTMAYGKALSLSLRMLFIEAASVYADNDSVIVVSRPMGAYYSESLERFTAQARLSLADLQALMLGQAFTPGKGTATPAAASDFALADAPDITSDGFMAFTIAPRNKREGADWHFTAIAPASTDDIVAPQLFALDVVAGGSTVSCSFAKSTLAPAGVIASMMQIEGKVKKHDINLIISASSEKAQWNTGAVPRRPAIPKNARRMTTDQVLKMLNKL